MRQKCMQNLMNSMLKQSRKTTVTVANKLVKSAKKKPAVLARSRVASVDAKTE